MVAAKTVAFFETLESRRMCDGDPWTLDTSVNAAITGTGDPVALTASATGSTTDGFSSFKLEGEFSVPIEGDTLACDGATTSVSFTATDHQSYFGGAAVMLDFHWAAETHEFGYQVNANLDLNKVVDGLSIGAELYGTTSGIQTATINASPTNNLSFQLTYNVESDMVVAHFTFSFTK